MGRLLTPAQAARVAGLHVVTVRALCESGKLPAVNIGSDRYKLWRIREEDLAEFFTPPAKREKPQRGGRRQALDANVEKVF